MTWDVSGPSPAPQLVELINDARRRLPTDQQTTLAAVFVLSGPAGPTHDRLTAALGPHTAVKLRRRNHQAAVLFAATDDAAALARIDDELGHAAEVADIEATSHREPPQEPTR